MSFTDPIALIVATVSKSLARVGTSDGEAKYSTSDRAFQARIAHSFGRNRRSVMRFEQQKTAADPLVTGTNRVYNQSVQMTLASDASGWSTQEQIDLLIAAADFMKAGTNATKFVGGES